LDFDPQAPKEISTSSTATVAKGPSNFYGMPVFHRNRIYIAGGGRFMVGKKIRRGSSASTLLAQGTSAKLD